MNTQQLVDATILKATGKKRVFAPGSKKYERIVGIANYFIGVWEAEHPWTSLYDPELEIGKAGPEASYELPDEVRTISKNPDDKVRILRTDGGITEFMLVEASSLRSYSQMGASVCAKIGRRLVFGRPFLAGTAEVGGAILVPCYQYSERLTSPYDPVPVDDPNWLIVRSAAEYALKDLLLQNQAELLEAEASSVLETMKDDDRGAIEYAYMPWSLR